MNRQTQLILGITGGVIFVLVCLYLFFGRQREADISILPPAPPREVTPVPLPPPIPSTIAVGVFLPIQDVENLIVSALDDYLRDPIYKKSDSIEYHLTLAVHEITMKGLEGSSQGYSRSKRIIEVDIPLAFNGWARVSKQIFGKAIQKREDITGNAAVNLQLGLALNPDWSVTAEVDSAIFIQQAKIEILGLGVSVRGPLTKLVEEKVLPILEEKIVEYITGLDIKEQVSRLWKRLYEPIAVSTNPPISLSIEPIEILAQQPSGSAETLSIYLAIRTYITVNMGSEASPESDHAQQTEIAARNDERLAERELPNLHFARVLESGYRITAPLLVTYETIEQLARPYIEKTHQLKGIETLVNNLTIYGSQTELVAGLSFRMPKLHASGQIYLLGTPDYNPNEMTLSVTDFNYTLTTRNLLVEMAEHIGGGTFPQLRQRVESKLIFSLEEQLTLLQEKLQEAIENRAIGSYVRLHGTVQTITPQALYLTPRGVRIPFHLAGELSCTVDLAVTKRANPEVTSDPSETEIPRTLEQNH